MDVYHQIFYAFVKFSNIPHLLDIVSTTAMYTVHRHHSNPVGEIGKEKDCLLSGQSWGDTLVINHNLC